MEALSLTIVELVKKLFDTDLEVQLIRTDERFGDFSTNIALRLAKITQQNPLELANRLAEELNKTGDFEKVTVANPGFINVTVSAKSLFSTLDTNWSPKYGENKEGEGRTVIVEYPSQNMAKPYSIGHLRPGNQGWATKRLMEVTGWKVITDNHLGDYGAPFGIWVVGFLKFSNEEKLSKHGVYELGRVYIETKKALKEEAESGKSELANSVQNWLLKLENGDEEAMKYSQKFNEISLSHIHEIMDRLKISTEHELGEAFFAPKGKKAVQELLENGLAVRNDDGSVIVPLDEFGIDTPLLIQKSNGAALYATTDLATLLYREEKWHPDRVIYAVGAEQQFYFRQLFAMAKKIGIKTELIHLWFGLIDQINEDGTREKMSSRKGVVLMEKLLDKAEDKARAIVKNRNISEDDVKKVALGAIKFSDFIADRRTNILFNWDKIFALSGFSGPYVQYAAVRLNKIIRDNIDNLFIKSDYDYKSEKAVLLKLSEYPEIIKLASRDLEPHKVASYLYDLAKTLNRYYENTPISTSDVSSEIKSARLDILKKVSQVFNHGLGIIGIEIPNNM